MVERKVAWKAQNDNAVIGKRHLRIDGVERATGDAKYSSDINTKGTLFARLVTCPHGHAKIVNLDVEAVKKIKGVKAVHLFKDVGAECRWDGELIAAVAAERPEQADDGVRALKAALKFEVLEHFVDEEDLKAGEAAGRGKDLGTNTKGDVAAAQKAAKAVSTGYYGIRTISHCCLETHGSHCEWTADDAIDVHLSTQNVSGTGGQFAGPLGLDAANVALTCNYIGGGFGSKFAADEWGLACAKLAKEAGQPVRLMLDRATELKIGGNRPSGFAKVTVCADAEGNITGWESHHWGTSGINGSTIRLNQMPYVFAFDNYKRSATGLSTNCGPQRAWRAPNHPQLCAVSQTAIDDIAAKLGMDSYDVFKKNLAKTPRGDVYAKQMEIGAKLIDWKKKAHLHGKGQKTGGVVTGLGMALHTWGGRAHAGTCTVKIHPDGTVESFSGSQDIGTGTRTVIACTLAETFGLPETAVKVNLGSNKYPRSGPSGGSTTVGGVSGPNRRAGLELLWKIFDLVAAKYNVKADSLAAKGAKILSDGKAVCTWKEAAGLIGPMPIEAQGQGPKSDGLTDQGVAGIQMAEVSVDTETGQVRMNKFVAVQDCGLIICKTQAESQVYGALIMGIAYALTEERIMDNKTGRFINADMENYKLPRIGDIGELVVEMYEPESEYTRGVIGLGEPPVIACGAAISNAVANAIGVRVPVLPMTPKRVLDALNGGAV